MNRTVRWYIGAGLALSVVMAGIVGWYASSAPDGLERVAADHGLGRDGDLAAASPLAGYEVAGMAEGPLSAGLAGLTGVVATGLLAFTVFRWLARRRGAEPPAAR